VAARKRIDLRKQQWTLENIKILLNGTVEKKSGAYRATMPGVNLLFIEFINCQIWDKVFAVTPSVDLSAGLGGIIGEKADVQNPATLLSRNGLPLQLLNKPAVRSSFLANKIEASLTSQLSTLIYFYKTPMRPLFLETDNE
jgi:hypothetical protein